MTSTLVPFGTRHPSLFDDFRREMDGLISRFWEGGDSVSNTFSPAANVSENDKCYEISLDLPGINADAVNVEMKHGDLWITGERVYCDENDNHKLLSRECHYGRFQRMFRLGSDVDMDNVDAEYKDGVLKINVPKVESARPKKISIRK